MCELFRILVCNFTVCSFWKLLNAASVNLKLIITLADVMQKPFIHTFLLNFCK